MPHLDVTFLVSQLFWLAVIFAFCYFIVKYQFIPSIKAGIEEREIIANGDLHEAEELAKQSRAMQIEVEKMTLKAYADAASIREKAMLQAQAMINKKIDEVNEAFLYSVKAEEDRSNKMRKELEEQLPTIIGEVKTKVMEVIISS